MAIQLDAESEQDDSRLEELRDRAKSAVEAVRYWEGVLKQRVGEAEALDGWLASTLSALLGTREQRIEEAVGRVQEARTCLAAAKRAAQLAHEEVQAAEARHRELEDTRAERVMQIELLADEIRGSAHPAAAELDRIELALEEARLQLGPVSEALQAGEGLLAQLGSVQATARQAKESAQHDLIGVPFAGMQKIGKLQTLKRQMRDVAERGQRFEEAVSALGVQMRLGLSESDAPSITLDVLGDNFFFDLSSLNAIGEVVHRLDLAREELSHVLEPVRQHRAEVTERIGDLEGRRTALLERYLT